MTSLVYLIFIGRNFKLKQGLLIVTKVLNAKYKISRRLGVNLWGRDKDPVNSRNYKPGQHGPVLGIRRSSSDYGTQLNAKQKLKAYYGRIREQQFRRIFKEALRLKGDTGENLVALLERRLDMFVYRMNFAPTIFSARQLVAHKHIKVNGRVVNIASYRLRIGDEVEVVDSSKEMPLIVEAVKKMERAIPSYIEYNEQNLLKGKLLHHPKLADVPYPVTMEPHLVVEFYSR